MKKLFYISILLFLITGAIVWYKFVFAAGNDANTVSLLHMNGADGSTTFTDNAAGGTHTWTANGNAQIDTAQSKLGGASGLFDGTGDYLSTPDSDDWNFGAGDFTIDGWIYPTAGTDHPIAQQFIDGNNYLQFRASNLGIYFSIYSGGSSLVNEGWNITINLNTWYHVAVVRNGNSWMLFVNGIKLGTGNYAITEPDFAATFDVGRRQTNIFFTGSIDELRVSKGIARWAADFTPPGCEYNGACPPPKVPDIMIFE